MGNYDLPQKRSQRANLPQVVGHMVRGGAISLSILWEILTGVQQHIWNQHHNQKCPQLEGKKNFTENVAEEKYQSA